MDMPDTNIEAPAVTANPMAAARMKKINPKGRKLDKKGNPIVTKEELEASGMSLQDFLNKERGLKRRDGSKPDITAPMQGPAVKANPMADQKANKRALPSAGPAVYETQKASKTDMYKSKMKDIIKEKAAQEREEQYGSGLKKGGMVKKGRDGIAQRGKTKGRMC